MTPRGSQGGGETAGRPPRASGGPSRRLTTGRMLGGHSWPQRCGFLPLAPAPCPPRPRPPEGPPWPPAEGLGGSVVCRSAPTVAGPCPDSDRSVSSRYGVALGSQNHLTDSNEDGDKALPRAASETALPGTRHHPQAPLPLAAPRTLKPSTLKPSTRSRHQKTGERRHTCFPNRCHRAATRTAGDDTCHSQRQQNSELKKSLPPNRHSGLSNTHKDERTGLFSGSTQTSQTLRSPPPLPLFP